MGEREFDRMIWPKPERRTSSWESRTDRLPPPTHPYGTLHPISTTSGL